MITFGICLIYYGIALFLYQVHGWLIDGLWTPFLVRRAWEEFFGSPSPPPQMLEWIVDWLLSWPLSLALMLSGLGMLGMVFAARWAIPVRRERLRRRWIKEQCVATGYQPWAVPKVLRELDHQLLSEKMGREQNGG